MNTFAVFLRNNVVDWYWYGRHCGICLADGVALVAKTFT